MPILLDCNFVVDKTNGNGLGIRNLKGAGIQAVYMNTSATAAKGNNITQDGLIQVVFADNYFRSFSGFDSIVSPTSGSNIAVNSTSLTPGQAYIITSVGTSTAADWIALGLPVGQTPNVGSAFIALVSGTGSGSGQVQLAAASQILAIETLGDPNQTINPAGYPSGGYILLQILGSTSSSTTTLIPKNPTNGTVISLAFYLSNSSVTVAGE
jgi:hypothetical protein